MAVKLCANYSKKLGLPEFSSHSFSVAIEVEVSDLNQVQDEVSRIYELLQHSVDQEIQNPGFVPQSKGNALHRTPKTSNGRHHSSNGNDRSTGPQYPRSNGDRWNCTDGQRGFIQRILHENNIDQADAEAIAKTLFQMNVKDLNKMQASQLIEELLEKAGQPARQSRWQPQNTSRTS